MTNSKTEVLLEIIKKSDIFKSCISLFTILSGAFYAISSFIFYWLERSYLAFWGIPKEFIHKSSTYFLYNLITAFITVGLLMFFSFCFYQIVNAVISSNRTTETSHVKLKKVWRAGTYIFASIILLVFYFVVIHTILYLYINGTTGYTIYYFQILHDWEYKVMVVSLSFVFSSLTYLIGFCFSPAKKAENDAFAEKKHKVKPPKSLFYILTILLIISMISVPVQIYKSYIDQYKATTTFETIENSNYVILYKDAETFVVKPCLIIDNTIYINRDIYQLIDSKEPIVQTITLQKTSTEPVFQFKTGHEFTTLLETQSENNSVYITDS